MSLTGHPDGRPGEVLIFLTEGKGRGGRYTMYKPFMNDIVGGTSSLVGGKKGWQDKYIRRGGCFEVDVRPPPYNGLSFFEAKLKWRHQQHILCMSRRRSRF